MEKAKVYYTDFRTIAFGDGLPTKLKKLCRKAGIASIDMDGKFVAIKLHFGELGNISYLRPNYARAIVDLVKELGLEQVSDTAALQAIVDSVAAANQKSIDDYRGGKTNALGFLVGQCMKASKGKGNPTLMKEMLLKILEG